jgi:hypothetical protein
MSAVVAIHNAIDMLQVSDREHLPELLDVLKLRETVLKREQIKMTTTHRRVLFDEICAKVDMLVTSEFINSTKTCAGNTQTSERQIIQKVRDVLDSMGLSYKEAGSQQSKDFRDIGGIALNIEIKKTDSETVYFNDTCPTEDIFYFVFVTGKKFKRKPCRPAMCLYLNGLDFTKDSPWLAEYIAWIEDGKNRFARGENKKALPGIMEVYPRPTFKANISGFIKDKIAKT